MVYKKAKCELFRQLVHLHRDCLQAKDIGTSNPKDGATLIRQHAAEALGRRLTPGEELPMHPLKTGFEGTRSPGDFAHEFTSLGFSQS